MSSPDLTTIDVEMWLATQADTVHGDQEMEDEDEDEDEDGDGK